MALGWFSALSKALLHGCASYFSQMVSQTIHMKR